MHKVTEFERGRLRLGRVIRRLGLILVVLTLSGQGASSDLKPKLRVTVCFPCDDFFSVDDESLACVLQVNQKIVEIFRKHGVPLTVAVIPYVHSSVSGYPVRYRALTRNDETALLLRTALDAGRFEIAMHGFAHCPNNVSKVSEWMGKAVVLYNSDIADGYVEHGKNGIVVPYGDTGSLKQWIWRLYSDRESRESLGEEARRNARVMALTPQGWAKRVYSVATRKFGDSLSRK